MRVGIVGGGVAGLTLAAKLLQQGRTPVVIEQAEEFEDKGYSLGIYSLGSSVLHGLTRARWLATSSSRTAPSPGVAIR